ncbi:rho GTPase-activating protein 27 isoform X4 [Girardinichthys multiradiatus]|uniref:rho GTPase-activating protein 27 isoform X4 n=1 Tax=Girardinichthys multiradiatus TaxID=208333 RepID=UPI001FAD7731|nr:rho GTPase-activating protein 27 isoform X4 [Girardinichthys multiradiatus]
MAFVSVEFEFEYKTKDGQHITIKPNECYILVSKTNDNWWRVCKDRDSKPFYVPVEYVKEVSAPLGGPSGPKKSETSKSLTTTKPVDGMKHKAVEKSKKTALDTKKVTHSSVQDDSKETYRFSTFGLWVNMPSEALKDSSAARNCALSLNDTKKPKTPNTSGRVSITPELIVSEDQELYAKPRPAKKLQKAKNPKQDKSTEELRASLDDKDVDLPPPNTYDMDFPSPPPHFYDTTPEISITDCDSFPEPPEPLVYSPEESAPQHQSSDQTTEKACITDEKVEDENLRTAVYVNVAQLRQSISESPPSDPSPCSPSDLKQEGWEIHVDQESGQEYYYHPDTGRTTWDNPFLDSPKNPEWLPPEVTCSPSPSPSGWDSDWEQLVDETTGQPYFYNHMSGKTSWDPPEQKSPYSSPMEPMSVHRFQDNGPPPLPVEDYPSEDYRCADKAEFYEDVQNAGPPTHPKEYALSHVSRTIIPRANLDRSTPPGWNLTVEPNGTWVFTSANSPDQWIKSVDDQGQTYYYLRDGSKSEWTLPEALAAPSHYNVQNGDENENVPIIKNWRDSRRFIQTHLRNPSDHSSNSSSTGNSPEHNVQNLDKAGILNKTKVCENGKKVRKNWVPTWTVLHGGVLTFHKDPKSSPGTVNKTNQIVPEFTVDLKGATICWATKDKSSKKHVLELKGKNGVEFLVQYDTESIITDWYNILLDTIRQLDYQDHQAEEEDSDLYEKIGIAERDDKPGGCVEKQKPQRPSVSQLPSSAGETDPKKVRTKLMKFLMKRPTLQSVKEKGYIRDNVFGCDLATLCAQERTTVPSFVEKCIKAVERRGLDIDGLYRVSGNLAVIQKLRFKADHEELDLEDGQWEDVHVITGALKLFFRELPEPLFPYSHFNDFISAIRISDYSTKLSHIYELVKSLPPANHDTMKRLFGHLHRVIQCGGDNRMTVQNVAIVFGPTLLRPETETANITMHMVFQNQIVEFILNEYSCIFHCS